MYLLKRKRIGSATETVAYITELNELSSKLTELGFGGAKRQMIAGRICYRNHTELLYLEYGKTLRQEELA